LIADIGYKPVIVSRGYKGRYNSPALVVGDGRKVIADACQAGDEPILMASLLGSTPVVVGRDRYTAGRLAIERFNPDLLLLDDGFQHLKLHRDLDLLLLDADRPFGNTYLLPRGTLREPPKALLRADAIVLTRSQGPPEYYETMRHSVRPRPVFWADHAPVIRGMIPASGVCGGDLGAFRHTPASEQWLSRKLLAFSGLARNDQFQNSIRKQGATLKATLEFDDHHAYRPIDLHRIGAVAARTGAEALVTTEKDFVRLPKGSRLTLPLIVIGVALDVRGGTRDWREFIAGQLAGLLKRSG
jgi:tetraacyldisaccharide 4'-kinase